MCSNLISHDSDSNLIKWYACLRVRRNFDEMTLRAEDRQFDWFINVMRFLIKSHQWKHVQISSVMIQTWISSNDMHAQESENFNETASRAEDRQFDWFIDVMRFLIKSHQWKCVQICQSWFRLESHQMICVYLRVRRKNFKAELSGM